MAPKYCANELVTADSTRSAVPASSTNTMFPVLLTMMSTVVVDMVTVLAVVDNVEVVEDVVLVRLVKDDELDVTLELLVVLVKSDVLSVVVLLLV